MNTQKATILIVDDNPTNLDLLFTSLSQVGFKVLIAKDGANAIRQATLAQPDAILLDIIMPDLDGFATCRRLKNETQTRDIPVIFLTALTDTIDKVEGFKAGAVDYITKPFQQAEVLARLETHLTIRTLQKSLQQKNQWLQQEINERKRVEEERERLVVELQEALAQVKTLSGILPICAHCKKIRKDENYWQQIEGYIRDHSEAEFSHGICPDCMKELYPDFYEG
jgi:DNA-binding response OmpR family regulator